MLVGFFGGAKVCVCAHEDAELWVFIKDGTCNRHLTLVLVVCTAENGTSQTEIMVGIAVGNMVGS